MDPPSPRIVYQPRADGGTLITIVEPGTVISDAGMRRLGESPKETPRRVPSAAALQTLSAYLNNPSTGYAPPDHTMAPARVQGKHKNRALHLTWMHSRAKLAE